MVELEKEEDKNIGLIQQAKMEIRVKERELQYKEEDLKQAAEDLKNVEDFITQTRTLVETQQEKIQRLKDTIKE